VTGLELGECRSYVIERVGAVDWHDEVAGRDRLGQFGQFGQSCRRAGEPASPDRGDWRAGAPPAGSSTDSQLPIWVQGVQFCAEVGASDSSAFALTLWSLAVGRLLRTNSSQDDAEPGEPGSHDERAREAMGERAR
jgi:hypothetical protein